MNSTAQQLIQFSRSWLSDSVFPLWNKAGIDPTNGGFEESLSPEAKPSGAPRRAMVQARQIFSYAEALRMEVLPRAQVEAILKNSTQFLIQKYQLPSGAFRHAVHPDGLPESPQSELYTQAFALFGLARTFSVLPNPEYKKSAKALLNYLKTERRAPLAGFTEIKNDQILFQSNPHMHLFEAALAWFAVDPDPEWKSLCHELADLCQTRFIDPKTGALCEHFDQNWQPLRDDKGRFHFEPGHHYEWAWLFIQYEKQLQTSLGALPVRLFDLAENAGLQMRSLSQSMLSSSPLKSALFAKNNVRFAMDEVWSDLQPKKQSSRFWPQTERVKAAVELGMRSTNPSEQSRYAKSADEAMTALVAYLDSPFAGAWQDTLSETNEFVPLAPKASSLYHIILAMSEFVSKRPSLAESNDAK
jgi:mannose/cellobiose epimerase-like protein (N-acyl-D-glucosamine 2-epimerase family)